MSSSDLENTILEGQIERKKGPEGNNAHNGLTTSDAGLARVEKRLEIWRRTGEGVIMVSPMHKKRTIHDDDDDVNEATAVKRQPDDKGKRKFTWSTFVNFSIFR